MPGGGGARCNGRVPAPERISIELTNACGKACWFCYNHSAPGGETRWTVDEVEALVRDCAAHGTRAVSFGGGEPLQYPDLEGLLARLRGVLFRSLTTNGLHLDRARLERLVAAGPDKVHVSIHFPGQTSEVERAIEQVHALAAAGVASGVNLLVRRAQLAEAQAAAERLEAAGIGHERVVFLPMRGQDTPTSGEMSRVAGGRPFQSMSCLLACARSPRFCSIGWDRQVAWCSYTSARRPLPALSWAGLEQALTDLPLVFCGGTA